jgi:hypothetical protein
VRGALLLLLLCCWQLTLWSGQTHLPAQLLQLLTLLLALALE